MKFILAVAVKISERGQITIPKKLRDRFGMHHDVEVEITAADEGLLIRKRTEVEHPVERVFGILGRESGDGLQIADIDAYLDEIRGR